MRTASTTEEPWSATAGGSLTAMRTAQDEHEQAVCGPSFWIANWRRVLCSFASLSAEPSHGSQRRERVGEERRFWDAIPTVKNLQCAWQLLLQSANPRAKPHVAHASSKLVWQVRTRPRRRHLGNRGGPSSTSPRRSRGTEFCARDRHSANEDGWIGATRCAAAAYWASWADALAMEVLDASTRLDREGFWWRPSWQELRDGKRPPENTTGEPGEWQHGWQYWASSVSDSHFRKTTMLSVRSAASRAHLRSHSGLNAGAALAFAPTAPEYVIPTHLFRVLLLERLQLPLPVDEAVCSGCHAPLDPLGRHIAACARTGRLKKRATPIERMLVRVCREGGARVRYNAFLRDMNVGVRASDERRIEVLAQDLPCFGGLGNLTPMRLMWMVLCWRVLGPIKRRRTPNC